MTIVFISNYFNHHQSALSDELYAALEGGYSFIATEEMESERIEMGWGISKMPEYVRYYYLSEEERNECDNLINTSDVVLIGSAPWKLVLDRLKLGKLTFCYHERIYKERLPILKIPIHIIRHYFNYNRYKALYLLCASAFTSQDYSVTGTFVDKAYKWGYFPPFRRYENLDVLMKLKQKNMISILFVARLIEYKHPEFALYMAKRLRDDGVAFHLDIVGVGELESSCNKYISDNNLQKCITMLGAMSPSEVRNRMERANVFIFTSDRNEGWGAVLNEAMNSACAVLASSMIGSVPFLIEEGFNGCVFQNGNFEDFYNKLKKLCENSQYREMLGKNAYETIKTKWNAKTAAERLITLCNDINQRNSSERFIDGPCSKADIVKDNWY